MENGIQSAVKKTAQSTTGQSMGRILLGAKTTAVSDNIAGVWIPQDLHYVRQRTGLAAPLVASVHYKACEELRQAIGWQQLAQAVL